MYNTGAKHIYVLKYAANQNDLFHLPRTELSETILYLRNEQPILNRIHREFKVYDNPAE